MNSPDMTRVSIRDAVSKTPFSFFSTWDDNSSSSCIACDRPTRAMIIDKRSKTYRNGHIDIGANWIMTDGTNGTRVVTVFRSEIERE